MFQPMSEDEITKKEGQEIGGINEDCPAGCGSMVDYVWEDSTEAE